MKSTKEKSALYGCFLPSKRRRRFLFVFGYTDCWWNKYLPGFTHVALCEVVEGFLIVHDPCMNGCRTTFRTMPAPGEWNGYTVVEVVTRPAKGNKLIKPIFQTCTTIVQYLAGIDLGAILTNTLYQRLVDPNTQTKDGIREIKLWEPQQRYQPS